MGLVGIFPEIQLGKLFASPRRYKNLLCRPIKSDYLRNFEFVEKNNTTKLPLSKSKFSINIHARKVNKNGVSIQHKVLEAQN